MIAINKLLLAETHKISSRQKVRTFQRSGSTEAPARPARTLILPKYRQTIQLITIYKLK